MSEPEAITASPPNSEGRRPVLTVDLAAIEANWRTLDAMSSAETAAVVKADAYGLGVEKVGPILASAGVKTFFVATAVEASVLRRVIGSAPTIYVLNGASEGLAAIHDAGALPVLNAYWEIEAAAAFPATRREPLACAIQIDTGMNRLGLDGRERDRLCAAAGAPAKLDIHAKLDVQLIISHLACADMPEHPLNKKQIETFRAALNRLAQFFPSARASLAATGGILLGREAHFDLARPGVGLYGGAPFTNARPVVTLDAPIMRVWDVPIGAVSGYGAAWRAERPSRLATIPVGYADGPPRLLSGRGEARVNGQIVPFAGRVSMDLIVLDVTDAGAVSPGDRATLLDDALTIDRVAEKAETIGYEILTSLGDRFARRYKEP